MIKSVKADRLNYLFSFVIVALAGFMLYAMLPGKRGIWLFVNADTLYLPSIYLDLFVHKSGISGWHLNASPNFFPDMFIYFPMMAILKKTALTSMVFGVFQQLIVVVLLNKLMKAMDPDIGFKTLFLINLAFLIIPLSSILGEGNVIPSQVLLPAYHCGHFINSLLAGFLFFTYLRTGKLHLLILLGMVTILAVVSDRLFVMAFLAPATLLSIIKLIPRGRDLRLLLLLAVMILSTAAGYVIFNKISQSEAITIIPTGWKMFQFDNAWTSFLNLVNHFKAVIIQYPVQRWLIFLFLLFLMGSPIYLVKHMRSFLSGKMEKSRQPSYTLVLYLFLLTFLVLFTPVINGAYLGAAHIRYNFAALVMGALGTVYLLRLVLSKHLKQIRILHYFTTFATAGFIILLLFVGVKEHAAMGIKRYVNYYPDTSRVLDELQESHGLTFGVANYWQAKYTTMFSRNSVRLYSVHDRNFKPSYHVTNENWFHDGGKGTYADPTFNYLVVDGFRHTEKLETLFGTARDTIYNEGGIVIIKVPGYKFDRATREIYLSAP
ncbi:MAG: hypothetical protein ABFS38_22905 [Bacteroidota bacterium]